MEKSTATCVFSKRKSGSLHLIVDSCLTGVMILTKYIYSSITRALTEEPKVIGNANPSGRSSDVTGEPSCPSLDGF